MMTGGEEGEGGEAEIDEDGYPVGWVGGNAADKGVVGVSALDEEGEEVSEGDHSQQADGKAFAYRDPAQGHEKGQERPPPLVAGHAAQVRGGVGDMEEGPVAGETIGVPALAGPGDGQIWMRES